MAEFVRVGYKRADLLSLNIVRMHKMVIHLSDKVMSDGKTIKRSMLTASAGHSEVHKFPVQCPTPTDMNLWTTALRLISYQIQRAHRASSRVYQYKALKVNVADKSERGYFAP